MSIIEFRGGPITHRYLMNKTKSELASMFMGYLEVWGRLDWQPIATAPRDGTRVLVYRPKAPSSRLFGVDRVDDGLWWHSRRYEQPSHWQRLTRPEE